MTRTLDSARRSAPGRLVATSRGTLHAVVRGEGPDVVLLHGVTDCLHTWHRVQDALVKDHRVHAVDLPGHGLSDTPSHLLNVREMGEAVMAYLEAAGVGSAVLAGNSLGGGVSLAAAHAGGEKVRGVVLLCSIGGRFPLPLGLRLLQSRRVAELTPRLARVRRLRRFMMRDAFAPGFVAGEAYVERYWESWSIAGRSAYMHGLLTTLDAAEVDPWLSSLHAPIHVVHGEEDRTIPARIGREIAGKIPGAKLTMLPRIGHMPQHECPEDTARFVREMAATAFEA